MKHNYLGGNGVCEFFASVSRETRGFAFILTVVVCFCCDLVYNRCGLMLVAILTWFAWLCLVVIIKNINPKLRC